MNKTKRQIELDSNNPKTTILHVCSVCGALANHYTCLHRYLAPAKKQAFGASTYKQGVCDFCKRSTHITETRDFFYPDFSLVPKSIEKKLLAFSSSKQ